jgi:hypothetical protein
MEVMWRVAANTLNKQQLTTDKRRPSSSGAGRMVKTFHQKRRARSENLLRASDGLFETENADVCIDVRLTCKWILEINCGNVGSIYLTQDRHQ